MGKKHEKATLMNTPGSSDGRAPTVPIGEYGFLSDGEVSALVSPGGSIDWMCVPRFDSGSVFGAILGRHAGSFRVAPLDVTVPADRRYLPGTMIMETSWGTPTGWMIVRDALLIGPWHHENDRSKTYRRTPNDYEAEHILLRTIRCVSGEVQTIVNCEPAFDYGRAHARWEYTQDGYFQGEATADGHDVRVTLTTDMRLGFEGGQANARTLLKEGDVRFVALSWGGATPPTTYAEAYEKLVWTAHHWQHWLARGEFPDHPWRSYLQRSALTLKGLTYSPTGAVIAAGSTSLPETLGGNRNYDYRFTWIRDATFALWGMYSLGFDWEAVDFFSFIAEIADARRGPADHVRHRGRAGARGVRARPPPGLRELASGADRQRRLRPAPARRLGCPAGLGVPALQGRGPPRQPDLADPRQAGGGGAQALAGAGRRHLGGARRAPALHVVEDHVLGRGGPRRAPGPHVRRGRRRPPSGSSPPTRSSRTSSSNGVDERGVLTQYYGSSALDASLLLAPLVRFLPPDDPRIRATVMAIREELTVDGLVLRYKVEETDDGFSGEEGTFTICSFWMVSALCEIGEFHKARKLCAKLLSFAGPLELYGEEIDPHSGQHLGNFPQAFTHLALINAVQHVIRLEEQNGTLPPTG